LDNIVGHFVKVDKVPRMSSDRNVMYEQISNRLYILENYFYSQQFLNEMVNHD
jgi:hypothetical protein